jgi:hypothetical protein
VGEVLRLVRACPLPLRLAAVGAVGLGLLGSLIGLAIGLHVYAPTAWAATFEVGLPSAVLGAVLGAVVGSVALLLRRPAG